MPFLNVLRAIIGEPIVSFLAGAAITWLVSWWYYRRAGADLDRSTQQLRGIVDRVARMIELQEQGVKFGLRRSGGAEVTGLVVHEMISETLIAKDSVIEATSPPA